MAASRQQSKHYKQYFVGKRKEEEESLREDKNGPGFPDCPRLVVKALRHLSKSCEEGGGFHFN